MTRLIRLKELTGIVGYQRAAIYKKIALDEFPRPVALGERAVAWRSDDVESWVNSRQIKLK